MSLINHDHEHHHGYDHMHVHGHHHTHSHLPAGAYGTVIAVAQREALGLIGITGTIFVLVAIVSAIIFRFDLRNKKHGLMLKVHAF